MKCIKKLHVKNFKKFADETFEFNDDINILVGDNECGKSSVLEAIELCLNLCHRGRPISPEVLAELFNSDCVEAYLNGVAFQITMHTMPLIDYGAANELCSVISVPTKTCSRKQTINFGSPYPYAFVEHVTFKPILVL